jgi:hypothetical protein
MICVPPKVQTKQGSCLLPKCQWIQLGLGHLNNNENKVKWLGTLGWQNLQTFNVCHQTYQISLFAVPLLGIVAFSMDATTSSLEICMVIKQEG